MRENLQAANQNFSNPKKNLVLFLGYGYTARYVTDLLNQEGWRSFSLPTRPTRAQNAPHNRLRQGMQEEMGINLTRSPEPSLRPPLDILVPSLDSGICLHNQMHQNIASFYSSTSFVHNPKITKFTDHVIQLAHKQPSRAHLNVTDYIETILPQVTHILVTAPPNNKEDPALQRYIDVILNYVPRLKWLGYLSATSVYGDHKGKLVTEDTPCMPKSKRGENRLSVEYLWQALAVAFHVPVHIFRLAGIYGPERNTIQDVRMSKSVNVIKENHLTNRIYVKDIAQILVASMKRPTPFEIFNLSDDMPASTAALNDYIAFLLDKPELKKVPYETHKLQMSAMQKSFYNESKIVSNEKIKSMLGISLQYPSYREGISDILKYEMAEHEGRTH